MAHRKDAICCEKGSDLIFGESGDWHLMVTRRGDGSVISNTKIEFCPWCGKNPGLAVPMQVSAAPPMLGMGRDWAPPGTCQRPPEGWYCSKEADHEGPCPTYPGTVCDCGKDIILGPNTGSCSACYMKRVDDAMWLKDLLIGEDILIGDVFQGSR